MENDTAGQVVPPPAGRCPSPFTESNRRPSPYHGDALPTELKGQRARTIHRTVVNEKSAPHPLRGQAFYRLGGQTDDGGEALESLPSTAGPWAPQAQHGGPPAALLGRAVEALGGGVVGRFTMELHGPVPVARLVARASVVRPGRSIAPVAA